MRFPALGLALLLAAPATAQPFQVAESAHLRVVARENGWTVLRDVTAPRDAAETALVLVRAQRPVAAAARPGHLAAMLRDLRAFRFGPLPAETTLTLAGLAGRAIETTARAAPSGVALTLRAVCLFAADRSYLLIAAAPAASWSAVEPELTAVLEGFRPGPATR